MVLALSGWLVGWLLVWIILTQRLFAIVGFTAWIPVSFFVYLLSQLAFGIIGLGLGLGFAFLLSLLLSRTTWMMVRLTVLYYI